MSDIDIDALAKRFPNVRRDELLGMAAWSPTDREQAVLSHDGRRGMTVEEQAMALDLNRRCDALRPHPFTALPRKGERIIVNGIAYDVTEMDGDRLEMRLVEGS